MSRVEVKHSILIWALERSNLSQELLASKFPKIGDWLSGDSIPTLRQVELLAKASRTPLGYFFLEEPPNDELPIPHFRTLDDGLPVRPSPELIETVQVMQHRQAWMTDYLVDLGHSPLEYVNSANPGDSPEDVAASMREALNLQDDWASQFLTWTDALAGLKAAMEESGILVVANGVVGNNTHRKLDTEEFRGFVLVDDIAPLVFINNSDFKAAQMFTLGHELAHIFLGSSAAFDLRELQPSSDLVEISCNQIAAEFLVPEQLLRSYWITAQNAVEPFHDIARHFKVSVLVAARRALDLELINESEFFEFYSSYQVDERRRAKSSSGGDFYANQNFRIGKRFASAVMSATFQGKLLYTEAYRLTGLTSVTFDRYATNLGLRGGTQ